MKLNKFGKLYISHARNMTSGEISVISFISQVCSGNLKKYEENPSIPPKFNRIPTAKFMKRCKMSKRSVYEALEKLIKKGLLHKKKVKGKAFYFPADDYHGKYYGMVQEEHMVELTKNEKLVYGYLSACQGNDENCNPKISQIAHFTGKSKQIVSKTITSLVRKDVIKRVVNPQKSSTYFVKRFEKSAVESAKNLLGQSAENLLGQRGESAENVHHYINNLLKEDNNFVCNNPASGNIQTSFFEKDLKEEKEGEKDTVSFLESFETVEHISVRKESVQKYRPMSMTYINDVRVKKVLDSFSPAEVGHLKKEGVSGEEFARVKLSIETKNTGLIVRPLDVKKISENEKKSLQDFAEKYGDSEDRQLKYMSQDAREFIRFGFTASPKKRREFESLLTDIEKMNNVVVFDFGTKSKINGDSDDKKVW